MPIAFPLQSRSARRLVSALVVGGMLSIALTGAALAERVSVVLDQAKVMTLPTAARTVIVGNPSIADVVVQKNGVIVITGKTYGLTNLIALDAGGKIIAESSLFVEEPSEGIVTVQRGLDRESYSCSPRCSPTLVPGDSATFFTNIGTQADTRNKLAQPQPTTPVK